MQLLIIAMMLCLFAHDRVTGLARTDLAWPTMLTVALGAKLLVLIVYAFGCRWTYARLKSQAVKTHLRRLEWLGEAFRLAVLAGFLLDLHLGWLTRLRGWIEIPTGIQHPVLIDELAVLLPTLAMLGLRWWMYYPIHRRLRESAIMRRFDEGKPFFPVASRWAYVDGQFRYQVALVLVPLLCMYGWAEAVEVATGRGWFGLTAKASPWVALGGSLGVLLLTPLIIRVIWDTSPMPDGEIRQGLMAMCRRHRVRVNELLLWRTRGGMVNAAVMGLIAPLRFILITDGLLQQMPKPHVEAVMAHELGHVRKYHMITLVVSAVALIGLIETAAVWVLAGRGIRLNDAGQLVVWPDPWLLPEVSPASVVVVTLAGSVGLWLVGFGWVSRRAERQADSFAVAHLTRERGADVVDTQDAQTMIGALKQVAELSQLRADKHSWRHGSIRWRQAYLKTLVGSSVKRLPIDRQMRWVNVASVLALVGVAANQLWFR